MNYILILGNSYRDCKETFKKIKKQENTKYSYVTKVKHIKGIPFNDYIKTNGFNDNPHKDKILSAIVEKKNNKQQKPKKDTQQLKIDFNTPVKTESKSINKKENINNNDKLSSEINKENDNANKINFNELKEDNTNASEEKNIEEINDSENLISIDELNDDNDELSKSNDYGMDTQIDNSELTEESSEIDNIEEQNDYIEEIKPTGNPPRGWHARKEYIDEDGNVFNKGDYVGNVKDDN
jgi:hypothetical protein